MHLDSYLCVLCVEHVEEDILHLFFRCPFSQACWLFLGIDWDLTLDPYLMFLRAREAFNSVIFREVVIIATWCIWCHRNDIIFYGSSLSFSSWRCAFLKEMNAVTLRVKPQLKEKIVTWLNNLL
ncbi:hypothetical protein PVAP13_1KG026000 [Panicum virgatum]|uniref:Reverse transcriptase zinc-binding domain-containing protein n=1 Tax=Panicum virgatum TaxID=38727 RepID=A0A8T0XAC4_PANVG|nr:hypothetical protein PVAP13_1KG026000 [Panicum virgatum]